MTAPQSPADVLVIGGGITGAVAAYRLAQAGARVVLVDRYDLGTQASGRNAGSLHAQIQHASFMAGGEEWARAWAPSLALLTDSLALWHGLSDELGTDLEVRTNGGLLVAATHDQLRDIERKVAIENAFGIASRMLDRDELRREAPYVSEAMVGAELCPPEGKANPLLATAAVARAAVAAGADVRRATEVVALARDGDGFAATTAGGTTLHARRLVCAGGADLPQLTRMLGVDLPVAGEPMQVNVTESVAPLVGHLVYYAGGPLTLKQARVGSLLIGGGWPARRHPVSGRPVVDLDGMRRNLAIAREVVPAVGRARVLRTWVGVNNATPDQRPIIGPIASVPGLVVGTFPYLGFTAGPLMGALLADLALGRKPEHDLAPFAPDRF
jgi:glycine/D-amino acid oxidase-like deaminating enzyme